MREPIAHVAKRDLRNARDCRALSRILFLLHCQVRDARARLLIGRMEIFVISLTAISVKLLLKIAARRVFSHVTSRRITRARDGERGNGERRKRKPLDRIGCRSMRLHIENENNTRLPAISAHISSSDPKEKETETERNRERERERERYAREDKLMIGNQIIRSLCLFCRYKDSSGTPPRDVSERGNRAHAGGRHPFISMRGNNKIFTSK